MIFIAPAVGRGIHATTLRRSAIAIASAIALGVVPFERAVAATHIVSNCEDGSAGSLRATIANPHTISGDTIDLSNLTCSTITLTQGAIDISQDALTLSGNGAAKVDIKGAYDRVIRHVGVGALTLQGLEVSDGAYSNAAGAYGGCISSGGFVTLIDVDVHDCTVHGGAVGGAGVFANDGISLQHSRVTHNVAGGQRASGGGVLAENLLAIKYSTFDGNASTSVDGFHGRAGAAATVHGNLIVSNSTFSANHADYVAALEQWDANARSNIVNSTLSYNSAVKMSAIRAQGALTISNSTIVFNSNRNPLDNIPYGPIVPFGSLDIESSIVAGNINLALVKPEDLEAGNVTGANNIIASDYNGFAPGFVASHACPQLGPLADNGGATRTHAIGSASPAHDAGNNIAGLNVDQRGSPRVVGTVDIGAYEHGGESVDRIFKDLFEPACGF